MKERDQEAMDEKLEDAMEHIESDEVFEIFLMKTCCGKCMSDNDFFVVMILYARMINK